ncbi:MAG: hypothetical protein EOO77_04075 [Oxalobacteraceae bacterium]|nr:MAG: hypothetical protein EOO77_04075 [Oxalobacteraceae bacterium]
MATITEAGLQGEWFYLEEEQPLDRTTERFFILQDGSVRSNGSTDVVGKYKIMGDAAVIRFSRSDHPDYVMTLHAAGEVFDEGTQSVHANAAYRIEEIDEPVRYYGTFVRRTANYASASDISRRIS